MMELKRRTFLQGLGAAVTLPPGITLRAATTTSVSSPHLTKINPRFLVSPQDVHSWHVAKDSQGGPTMTGSPSWKNYLQIVENELHDCGVVDIFRNRWTFTRWSTTEFPDDSNWSLHIDGKKIKVASYGCNSGQTPADGMTGELVV